MSGIKEEKVGESESPSRLHDRIVEADTTSVLNPETDVIEEGPVEANPDEILEQLERADRGEPAPEEKPAAEEPAAETTEAVQTADSACGDGETEKPGSTENTAELARAVAALGRDGLSPAVIAKLSDEEALLFGLKAASRQSASDDMSRRIGELEKSKETVESPTTAESAGHAEQPAGDNLDDAVQPFTELFGEDAGAALTKALNAARGASQPAGPSAEEAKAQSNLVEMLLLRDVRRGLQDSFPRVAEDSAWSAIEEQMRSLSKTGNYTDPWEVGLVAARLHFSDEVLKADQNRTAGKRALKREGKVRTPSRKPAPASLSRDETENSILEQLELKHGVS